MNFNFHQKNEKADSGVAQKLLQKIVQCEVKRYIEEIICETKLAKRIIYKHSNSHRSKEYFLRFVYVVKLARTLSRVEIQETFTNFIESCSWDNFIFNLHLHLAFVGIVKKITQAFISVIKNAAQSIDLYLLTRNFFIPFSLCVLAILSRYNALACKFIQSISKIEKIFKNIQKNYETVTSLKTLPKNFKESVEMLEDVGIEIYSTTSKNSAVAKESTSAKQLSSSISTFSKKQTKKENIKNYKIGHSDTSSIKKSKKNYFRRKRCIYYRFKVIKKLTNFKKGKLLKKKEKTNVD